MRLEGIPLQHGVSWNEQKGKKQYPDFAPIFGQTTPIKFEVGGIVVWEKDFSVKCTCIVVSTDLPKTNPDFVDMTIIEHRTNVVFQPLKTALKSYGKDKTPLFKNGTKLYFFHDYFVLPLEFIVIQDMQKQNKEGMFTILANKRRSNPSNPDEFVEIQTFTLHGLVMNKKERQKRKHALMETTGYTGGYKRGGAATSGSPSPEIITVTITITLMI